MTKCKFTAVAAAVLLATASAAAAHADHYSRELSVINLAHAPVSALYVSGVGKEAWRQNLLDGGSLRPNHYVQFDLDDARGHCRFDFKAVFTEGTSVIRRNIDACVTATYTVTD